MHFLNCYYQQQSAALDARTDGSFRYFLAVR